MKISVIIPVYNCEKYLKRCLDSLVNQTYKDIEIICVDDGSTDKSLDVLREYASRHDNIRVFSQNNSGPSKARNLGMDNAKGEYITFVDSDDWLEVECFEVCMEKIEENNPDLLFFNYTEHKNGYSFPNKYYAFLEKYVNTDIEYSDQFYKDVFYYPLCTVAKLVKKEFLERENIKFLEDINYSEDKVLWYQVLLKYPKVYVIENNFYNYDRRFNSLTGTSYKALLNLLETVKVLRNLDFYKNADAIYQAIMLDWLVPDVNYYWIGLNDNQFKKEINEFMDLFKCFDKSILSQLKVYPMFKIIWYWCQIPIIKWLYIKFTKIPAPVLKKIKKFVMR